jgi:hypothetical protein
MEEQTILPFHSTTNSTTKTIVAEQETTSQKKLSFSIDSILDKQQQQQQPLFNCSNFKIKRHHHSTPNGKKRKSICFETNSIVISIQVIIIDHQMKMVIIMIQVFIYYSSMEITTNENIAVHCPQMNILHHLNLEINIFV